MKSAFSLLIHSTAFGYYWKSAASQFEVSVRFMPMIQHCDWARTGGLWPEHVYLHAGTTVGAEAIGLDTQRHYLELMELPTEFHQLQCYEAEDVLCIYKEEFAIIYRTRLKAGIQANY